MSPISKQIKSVIDESRQILLHLHPSPDGDSVGSALAMYHYLNSLGKDVHLIKGDSDLKTRMSSLPGFNVIENMSFADVDLSKFDLFISLDSQDLTRISKLIEIKFPSNLKTINIDHHSKNTNFADINIVDANSSATSEILYNLFTDLKVKISPDMAACLYFGIYYDTDGFHNLNTTYQCLEIIAKLAKINPNFLDYILAYEHTNTPSEIKLVALSLNSVKEYFGGKVAISSMSYKTLEELNLINDSSKKTWTAQFLRTVPQWVITAAISENEPKISGISMRSSDPKWNVATIAKATGEGGGHPVAAGATIYRSAPSAIKKLLEAIQKTYPELGKP